MSWRKRIKTLTMTLTEFNRGITRKPNHIEHSVGEVCKPMERGTNNAIGVSNRVRIISVAANTRSILIHFERL